MKLSAILAPLLDAKADHETIRKLIMAFEGEQSDALTRRRENDAKRQAEKRGRDKSRDVTLRHSDSLLVTRVEDSSSKKDIGKEEKKERAAPKALPDLSAFKADLEQDATPEQVEAFAKHRKAKNGQNSAYAATLFRRDATACGLSVSEAIDTAISRGWLTVKPEYLAGRHSTAPPRTGAPAKGRDFNDVLDELQGKNRNDAQPGPVFDASVNRTDFGSTSGVVQLHALPARR